MPIADIEDPTPRPSLRLWPGIVAGVLLGLVRFVAPIVVPEAGGVALLVGVAGGLAVIGWWLFFSRAPWPERVGAIALMVGAAFATWPILHESVRNGMMGMMFVIYVIPVLSLALVAWAVASRRLASRLRRPAMVLAILAACGTMTLIRTGGITGDSMSDLHWRWTPTPEDRLLARAGDDVLEPAQARTADLPAAPPTAPGPAETPGAPLPDKDVREPSPPVSAPAPGETPDTRPPGTTGGEPTARSGEPPGPGTTAEWPGFRGPARDGVVRRVRIETDWLRTPPVELWRRPIGPGWSSFAVAGDLVYTQEQRGDDELVSCYRLTTGEPIWAHRDAVRFWESNGGAGPRATPTLGHDRVYALGATGIVNALDARTGAVVWSRNAATDTGEEIPGWGFAGSPLVVDDLVIVAVAGRLAAYDAATGDPRWFGPPGGGGYSSPHLATIDGVTQILLLRGTRTTSVAPADGAVLWEHSWPAGVSILQPALMEGGDVLIAPGDAMGGIGMRRVAVAHGPLGWTVDERWTSRGLKPYFNDFVVHQGHAYGFDGSILASIDLSDGTRTWKGGRYGHGQLVLLPDQDLLLVLSEVGELALVGAVPDGFAEIARFPAIEGKTWNHPVLVGDVLLVRNGEEMVAFQLSLAGR